MKTIEVVAAIIKKDDKIFVVVEEDREKFFGEPPTKLKNPKHFQEEK